MNKIDSLLKEFSEINEQALYPTDMKAAIIGYVERAGMQPQILLDRETCIKILIKEGMSREDAEEYFEFNTIGSFMGEDATPCFATLIKDIPS
jgi:hypothetical protein